MEKLFYSLKHYWLASDIKGIMSQKYYSVKCDNPPA